MEHETLNSIDQLQSKVVSWLRTLLFLVLGFLLHLVLPIKIGKIFFGEIYTWIIPIIVLLPLLSWDMLQKCKAPRIIWRQRSIAQRRALMRVNPENKSLMLIDTDSPTCRQLELLGWFEPPVYDRKEIADLERETVTYRLTPLALRFLQRYNIRPFHK